MVVDLADRAAPRELGRTAPLPDYVDDLEVAGGYAYLACRGTGLVVVDVRDPGAPEVVATMDVGDSAAGVSVGGGVAVVIEAITWRAHVVDVRDPTSPREVGVFPCKGNVVSTDGATAVFSGSKVHAFDIRDPRAPREIGEWAPPGNDVTVGVVLGGGRASALTHRSGLFVLGIPGVPGPAGTATPSPGATAPGGTAPGATVTPVRPTTTGPPGPVAATLFLPVLERE